jgi:hypothetical protein
VNKLLTDTTLDVADRNDVGILVLVGGAVPAIGALVGALALVGEAVGAIGGFVGCLVSGLVGGIVGDLESLGGLVR